MRITRTIIATLSMAMLTFTLLACESDEKKQPKKDGAAAEQAEEPPKAQEQKANNEEGVFTFNREEFLKKYDAESNRKDPLELIELATGEKPCEGISNPVKKQDCMDNININDVFAKIHKEKIGKTKIYGLRAPKASPKPESRFLCRYVDALRIWTRVLNQEMVDKLKQMNDNGKNQAYGIEQCITLVENKYIVELLTDSHNDYYSDIVIFNNKEDAMNFDEKGPAPLKLKKRIFAYGFYAGNSYPRNIVDVFEYDSPGLKAAEAEAKEAWSTKAIDGEHTFDEAKKLCSSRGERLPTYGDLDVFNVLKNKELSIKFEGNANKGWWSSSIAMADGVDDANYYYCEKNNDVCYLRGYNRTSKADEKGVVCVKK